MITPGGKVAVPDSVQHLDLNVVVEVLSRHSINVSDAARELGVASADLRRLLYAKPHLTDMAVELEERRLDQAEKNIFEALHSDDSRRRDAASFFVVRNSHRARRRGWITSSTSAAELSVNMSGPGATVMLWRDYDADDATRAAQAAEIKRLQDEGKRVITIGWGAPDDPDDDKAIEHQRVAKD
jgi:hypothetical protein